MHYHFERFTPFIPHLNKEKQLLLSFVSALFVSALLLFAIQPMFAKMVLPLLGGSPSVWSVAMCFFQGMLLLGYAYAYALIKWCTFRQSAMIHLIVLLLTLISLPIAVARGWDTPPGEYVSFWVMGLFAISIGLPFFALSGNATLLQAWFSKSAHKDANDPYFLYGASNLGSLLALLLYPFVFEPLLSLSEQSSIWSYGYVLLICLVALSVLSIWNGIIPQREQKHLLSLPMKDLSDLKSSQAETISWRQKLYWVILAVLPSALLVAVTSHITTDIAAAPFMWILPLSLYLITFIITFQRDPLLKHNHILLAMPFVIVLFSVAWVFKSKIWLLALLINLTTFFVIAMMCHGELAKRRPHSSRLTAFYLSLSFGGMIGGIFSGLIAPYIFSSVLEYPLLIMIAIVLHPYVWAFSLKLKFCFLAALLVSGAGLVLKDNFEGGVSEKESFRGFFGVNHVIVTPDRQHRLLVHGTTIHGAQHIGNLQGRPEPLTYYHTNSSFAEVFNALRQERQLNAVGVIGLGVGSLACYKQDHEKWAFYEIDPIVIKIARDASRFTFLEKCAGNSEIVMGDARQMITRKGQSKYDLLIVDAFSSDVIPVHLLTLEAMKSYLERLKDNGVLLMHISNRHIDLTPVLSAAAGELKLYGLVHNRGSYPELKNNLKNGARVVILTKTKTSMPLKAEQGGWQVLPEPLSRVWTDDYSNVLGLIWDKVF